MAVRIGTTIAHYKILDHVGTGGMGMVYKAQDLKLGRCVALKFLPPEVTQDPEAKRRFIEEARAASSVQHKNICVIHDIDETDDGLMFISMEWLDGQTLKDRIAAGFLPVEEIVQIGMQVAQGLARAHESRIVHRDIKPANIIVTNDRTAKILDFGVAKVGGLAPSDGTTVGTVAYMSPEQSLGQEVDHRTDLWSLGVVLYEMATGRRPFAAEYEQAATYAIVHEKHPPARSLRAELPQSLEKIINRCLEKSPSARYPDAAALLEDLRKVGAEPPPAWKAIAVMTFADISMEQDNRYFSDGLTEEIIAKLSRLPTLKVVSRTSVVQYERAGKSMKQIAADLGVQFVLEGSVRKHGSELRITAQLVDASQDAALWGETYNGSMEELFDIQEKVASRIVKALKVRLTPAEKRTLKRKATENMEAYQLYLKGRFFWNKRNGEDLQKAIRLFEEAIGKDPHYARARAGIADAYNFLSEFTPTSRKDTYPVARAAVEKALKYDDGLAEAHASMGLLLMLSDWNWAASEREFRLALKLDPNYATAHHWWSEWLSYRGRLGEALEEMTRAAELDPLSAAIIKDKGMLLYYAKDFDGAIAHARNALELDRNFSGAHRLLSLAYVGKGMIAEAVRENERWGALSGHPQESTIALAYIRAVEGKRDEALAIVKDITPEKILSVNICRGIALVHTALGDHPSALTWLEVGYTMSADALTTIKIDHKLEALRREPRFLALMRTIGLG